MTIRTLIVAAIASLGISGSSLGQTLADFYNEEQLTASDGEDFDLFGKDVVISGDTAIITAEGQDDNGINSGKVYVFQRTQIGTWSEVQQLVASNAWSSNLFGSSVAISEDTLLIGAHGANGNVGSAYIFMRNEAGTWSEVQMLSVSDGVSGDWFGLTVAIDGNTAFIGAPGDDDLGIESGSIYIFHRDPAGTWSQVSKINEPNGGEYHRFGDAIAIEGQTAIVGVEGDWPNGSAYIYEKNASYWSQTQKLLASDGEEGDDFGSSVAISGDSIVIGADTDQDGAWNFHGSAYVFRKEGGTWNEHAKLTASDGQSYDAFGGAVTIEDDTVIVGAPQDDDYGTVSGCVYVYQRSQDDTWSEIRKLNASDAVAYSFFGYSVSISEGAALIGVGDYYASSDPGQAYVFDVENVVLNLDYGGKGYRSIEAAAQEAIPNERFAVRSAAFNDGIINTSSMPFNYIAVEQIVMDTDVMFLPGDGSTFEDSEDAVEGGYAIAGRLISPSSGSLTFNTLEVIEGGQLHQNDCSFLVNGPLATSGGVAYLSDEILALEVSTGSDGVNRVIRETEVLGDYLNNGTTAVHRGTLYIYGDLSGEGTMLGDVDTGPGLRGGEPPAAGDGFSIGGSSILGADASLRMLDFDWTLGIGGDVDWAIDANDRFAMSGATLDLTGLDTGLQAMELMSLDVGPDDTGFDPTRAGHFPLGTLRVGSGTTVNLVDNHDNGLDDNENCEALYASTLVVEPGATLITGGCPVYVQVLDNQGAIDGEIIEIPDTPTCLGDLDGNGAVDIEDLLATLNDWGCEEDCTADVNEDGSVDISDLLTVIANWGSCAA